MTPPPMVAYGRVPDQARPVPVALAVTDLHRRFGAKLAVDGVSFTVEQDEISPWRDAARKLTPVGGLLNFNYRRAV